MSPQIIIRSKEEDRELANIMSHFINVGRNSSRMADLSWPPPVKGMNRGRNF
jgi:hypothetical protein